MNKIKFLSRSLLIVNMLFVILLVAQIVIFVITGFMKPNVVEDRVFGIFHHLVLAMQVFVLLLGLWNLQHALKQIIKLGLYNEISEQKIRKGGFLLILFGIISFLFNMLKMSEFELDVLINNLSSNVFVSLVGIGLLILSDFINKGMVLKEDVDLTI